MLTAECSAHGAAVHALGTYWVATVPRGSLGHHAPIIQTSSWSATEAGVAGDAVGGTPSARERECVARSGNFISEWNASSCGALQSPSSSYHHHHENEWSEGERAKQSWRDHMGCSDRVTEQFEWSSLMMILMVGNGIRKVILKNKLIQISIRLVAIWSLQSWNSHFFESPAVGP